jgi:methyl-accepting chemotaxis protein
MEDLSLQNRVLGLTTKFVLFFFFFMVFCVSAILGGLYWITDNAVLVERGYIALCIIFFFQYLIYQTIRRIKKRNHIICGLLHEYAEEGQSIGEEFAGPKKNIKKSFDFQQDSLNKTGAAMEEIKSMISRTKDQVNDCNDIIKIAEDKVEEGKYVMSNLENAIETIKQATKDMDMTLKIINEINIKSSVITEIVAKTELLAMNASIEAARAGEFGKGFSVVSEEVGDLARNSGKSAKQIKELLNESSMKVSQVLRTTDERIKEGERICKQVLTSFENIQMGIRQLKEQANIILTGTEMQSKIVGSSSSVLDKISKSIGMNAQLLDKVEDSIDELLKNNNENFCLAEGMHEIVSGSEAANLLRQNRNSKVRRTLLEFDI